MSETSDHGGSGADGTEAPLDFDPYRFGAPEHPVPPEYAPPGYVPPPQLTPPPPDPNTAYPSAYPPPLPGAYPGYPQQGYQQPGYPQQGYQQPGYQQPGQQPPMYPPGPGYPPPNYSAQYPSPRTGNGRATAGMVLGIASILLCWLTFFDIIPVALGLIFSIMGRTAATRAPQLGGRGQATAGIVCSAIGAVLAITVTVVVVHAANECGTQYAQSSSQWNTCIEHRLHLK